VTKVGRRKSVLGPSLVTLAAFIVLIVLGTWQLERKAWKEGLIAQIAARVHAGPVPLPAGPSTHGRDDLEYLHVSASGRFHHDKERYLYAPTQGGPGWHVYTPLELEPQRIVWVNRGWVPELRKAPDTRPQGQVPGEVEVRGLVRLQVRPGWFTPQNDPARNLWYWPDIAAMTASAFPAGPQTGPGRPQRPVPLPLVLEADAQPEPPGGLPRGGVTRLELPNRHLEYAVTWYGLAGTLVGVYLAFAISRLRADPR
jgi:surfeit locus 1 family protein